MDAAPVAGDKVAISLSGITKRFPGVVANSDISLTFRRGEVHALLGENGAGKSTLIGVLAGMQQPDEGRLFIEGEAVRLASPRDALRRGIGTVYQHVLLIPSLTVLENLMLGSPWWRPFRRARVLKRFEELSELLSVRIHPDALVGRLSLGEQQQIEIMRAIWHGELVLILDEPTSMLTPAGVKELAAVVGRLRDHGLAVIFITHKLHEAYELADCVSVLRLGKVVGEIPPERFKRMSAREATDAVVAMMFGKQPAPAAVEQVLLGDAVAQGPKCPVDRSPPPLLALSDVATGGQLGEAPLRGVSFSVWPGEVLGIAGIDGNGQKHLAEVLAGQRPVSAGRLTLQGEDVTALGVSARRRLGVRYITDERLGEGTVGSLSVAVNLLLKDIGRPPFWSGGWTRWGEVDRHARAEIARHDVRTPSEHTAIAKLSGGNIQKVLLARELSDDSALIVFNKPTYGLDLQNTQAARQRIRDGAGAPRAAIVVISTELDELMETCHRIAVMDGGEIRGIVQNRPGAEQEIGRLMTARDMTGGRHVAA